MKDMRGKECLEIRMDVRVWNGHVCDTLPYIWGSLHLNANWMFPMVWKTRCISNFPVCQVIGVLSDVRMIGIKLLPLLIRALVKDSGCKQASNQERGVYLDVMCMVPREELTIFMLIVANNHLKLNIMWLAKIGFASRSSTTFFMSHQNKCISWGVVTPRTFSFIHCHLGPLLGRWSNDSHPMKRMTVGEIWTVNSYLFDTIVQCSMHTHFEF